MKSITFFLIFFATYSSFCAESIDPLITLEAVSDFKEPDELLSRVKELWSINKINSRRYWTEYPEFKTKHHDFLNCLLLMNFGEYKTIVDKLWQEDLEFSFLFPLIERKESRDFLANNTAALDFISDFLLEAHFNRPLKQSKKRDSVYQKNMDDLFLSFKDLASSMRGKQRDPNGELYEQHKEKILKDFEPCLKEIANSISIKISKCNFAKYSDQHSHIEYKFTRIIN
jgi:hypothetical protein